MLLLKKVVPTNTIEQHKGGVLVGNFHGIRPFLDRVATYHASTERFRMASSSQNSFYSYRSMEEAINVYRNDPRSLIKYVKNELDIVQKEEIGQRHWMDVTGDFLDIGTYLEGDPECFGNMFMGNPKRIFCTIMLKLDIRWNIGVDYLNYYSARILRLIEWLERKEIRVRLVAYSSTEMDHIEITVKDFYEPVTLASIAIVANVDFYRRLIFRVREHSPVWKASYGSSEKTDQWISDNFADLVKKIGGVVIYMDRNAYVNNRDATQGAFDSAEEYMADMIAGEKQNGAFII